MMRPFLLQFCAAALFWMQGTSSIEVSTKLHNRNVNTPLIPAPVVIPSSQYFDGIDGQWSTINIRIGTPPQNVRVIVSTNSPYLMVVLPSGCSTKAIASPPADCVMSRGGIFNSSTSSTWNEEGTFYINSDGVGLEANLGYKIGAKFGLETVGLGYTDGANGPVLTNQTVAGFATASQIYLGLFGLNPEPENFTTIGNFSAPSYLSSLKDQNLIPSLSWSYTAGAHYRLKTGSLTQLIFGGYDASHFLPNSATFTLNEDTTRDIVVAVQSISVSGAAKSKLLNEPIFAFIESTDPNIWLPESACTAFEEAFGLELDNTTNLYLINDTHYTNLLEAESVVTFRLANSLSGGSTVDIAFPISAFVLQAAYPLVSLPTRYFPLRKADNQTQHTLGRTFLQEAYLTVDYERRNFSVSQATFTDGATRKIVPILSPSLTSDVSHHPDSNVAHEPTSSVSPQSHRPSGLSAGSTAGITISVVIFFVFCSTVFWWHRRRATRPSPSNITRDAASQPPKDVLNDDSDTMLSYLHQDTTLHGMLKPELEGISVERDSIADKARLDLVRISGTMSLNESKGGEVRNMPMLHEDVFELQSSDHGVDGADFTRHSRPLSTRSSSTQRTFGGELESPTVTHELHGTSTYTETSRATNVVSSIYSPVSSRSNTAVSPLNRVSDIPSVTGRASLGGEVVTPARSPLSIVSVPVQEDIEKGAE